MSKIRAICIGDVRYSNCPVFELNEETNEFIMITDSKSRYNKETVYEDKDFLVFLVNEKGIDGSKNCVEKINKR